MLMDRTSLSRWSASMAVGPQYKEANLDPSSDTAICAIWSWTQTEDGKWPALELDQIPRKRNARKTQPTDWKAAKHQSKNKASTKASKIQQMPPKSSKRPQNPIKAPKIQQKPPKSNESSLNQSPPARVHEADQGWVLSPRCSDRIWVFWDCCLILWWQRWSCTPYDLPLDPPMILFKL